MPPGAASSSSIVVVTGEPLMAGAGPPLPTAFEREKVRVSSASWRLSSTVERVTVWKLESSSVKVRVPETVV